MVDLEEEGVGQQNSLVVAEVGQEVAVAEVEPQQEH